MKTLGLLLKPTTIVCLCLIALAAAAADYPAPKEGDWIARDFRFHTGEVMPELRLHYTTVGAPSGQPVLILHGTTGSGAAMLSPAFAGELFGPGLRTKFPRYNYDDMVAAQHKLVTEGLGIRHLRLVLGNSMGGMHTWIWGVNYPDVMDALVPMASQPTEISGRNWMMRRMLIDAIRNDPAWNNGDYVTQPRSVQAANVFFGIATSGGTQAYHKLAPTREQADKFLDDRLAAPFKADANDFLYQWDASRDYNPAPGLERVQAALLAINSADDERNPPELGILEREIKRIKNGRMNLIPGSEDTRGHGTTGMARFWKQQVEELLQTVPRRAM
jgi:homoserine O-acetyltransferase/O-succinyltransferase